MPIKIQTMEHIIRIISIKLSGRLDIFEAPRVRAIVEQFLDAGENHFVFDLTETEMIDSAGLAVMVSALKRARMRNGDVRIIWPKENAAARILRLTKFDQVFTSIDPSQIVPPGF